MGQISLRDMLDRRETLSAYCKGLTSAPICSHGNTVDIAALMAKVGDVVDLYSWEVQRHLRCKRCGRRGATFICSPDPRSTSAAGRAEIEAERQNKSGAKL